MSLFLMLFPYWVVTCSWYCCLRNLKLLWGRNIEARELHNREYNLSCSFILPNNILKAEIASESSSYHTRNEARYECSRYENFGVIFPIYLFPCALHSQGQFEFGNRIYEVSWECLFHMVFPVWPEVHFCKDLERKICSFFNSKATL